MVRNLVACSLLVVGSAVGAEAALSPTAPGLSGMAPPSPSVVHIGGRPYRSANVLVGGARVEASAFLRRDRSWLPARAILSRLGGGVEWAPSERAFYASFPRQNIVERIEIGSRVATVYRFNPGRPHLAGERIRTEALPAAPFIVSGHAYAPLRGLVEAVGGRLAYYPDSRTVYVTLPRRVGVPAP